MIQFVLKLAESVVSNLTHLVSLVRHVRQQLKLVIHAQKVVLLDLNHLVQMHEHELVCHFDHFVRVDVRCKLRQMPNMLLRI